ncbi:MAG TPA: hypothetical protein VJ946_09785, partial [Bacteroidales bacterium]|nr:hypothetical protein [Bacteroidales bacterium]
CCNTSGQIKAQQKLPLNAGMNTVRLAEISPNIDNLPAGVYVLHIQNSRSSGYLQLVKTE